MAAKYWSSPLLVRCWCVLASAGVRLISGPQADLPLHLGRCDDASRLGITDRRWVQHRLSRRADHLLLFFDAGGLGTHDIDAALEICPVLDHDAHGTDIA